MREAVAGATGGALLLLSGAHFYWAAGGARGKSLAVPERNGQALFRPSAAATLAVAALLAAAGVVVIAGLRWGCWALALVFAARAIGDGRWVGLFKRVRGTRFAKLDTYIYSPLCAALCLGCVYAAL